MPVFRTAFISHAHANNEVCARYAAALRAKGIDVWIDLMNAQKGHSLTEDITTQLERCSAFVLMVTHASSESYWVGLERNNYIALWADKTTHFVDGQERMILPVRLEDCPVPTTVRGFNWIDAVDRPEDQVVEEIARALALPAAQPHTPVPAIQPVPPMPPPAPDLPGAPSRQLLPRRLTDLGFFARTANGADFVIPPMRSVPAGDFIMGSDATQDQSAQANEMPQYLTPIERAYQIGTYPLTVAEYACAVRAKAVREPQKSGDVDWAAQMQKPDHPVVRISWQDVLAYTRWLAQVTGQPWRLPTEAEWEKAARGTDGRIYPWGNQWDKNYANTSDGSPKATTPVGSYPQGASPYGCLDMAGNVWEWTSTLYRSYPYNGSDGRENLDSTGNRVLRGGSWTDDPRIARAAYRGDLGPAGILDGFGARLARAVAAR